MTERGEEPKYFTLLSQNDLHLAKFVEASIDGLAQEIFDAVRGNL